MDLIDLITVRGVAPVGVVHVGAHRGTEVPDYRRFGFERIVLVEPEPDLAARLRVKFPDCVVVEKVCAQRAAKRRKFNVATRRQWSSLVDVPADQSKAGPVEVRARIDVEAVTLRSIQAGCNVAVVDTQGTEHDVLAGADLSSLELVVVETVTPGPVWRPAWDRPDADAWFAERGWWPVAEFAHSAPDVLDVAYAPTGA